MAGTVIVMMPVLIAFWLAQRWFIEGLTSAALK
jgi:ABC-type glycerol-3-phosphate transport system permease component